MSAKGSGGPGRIAGLDGLRAVSIVLVMASHAAGTALVGGGSIPLGEAHRWGKVGVRVFFVISGFLITKLLLDEETKFGDVSVKAFYVRRAFRILPAFLVYLAFVGALTIAGREAVPANDFIHALTYTVNFDVSRHWLVSHMWSLSVEEQFYLLWPLAFGLLGARRAFWVAVLTCVIGPIARWVILMRLPEHLDALVWQAFPAVGDSIATGCILAFVWMGRAPASVQPLLQRIVALAEATPATYLLFPAAFFTYLLEYRPTVWTLVGVTFSNVAFALVVARVVKTRADGIGRVLVHKWIERVGVLSYSLYLWQQVFLRQSVVEGSSLWKTACSFPLSFVLAYVLAHVSYELVERRALRAKPRWADRTLTIANAPTVDVSAKAR
ncbi:MAG: acyltransferase [Polyangiaceae bacterium]|nr:acyltransferase [Polyangiaceae bacterium]